MRLALPLALLGLLAGCVAPAADTSGALDDAATPAPAAVTEEPLTFDGTFGPGAVVCTPVTCAGQSMGNRMMDIDVQGVLTSANLTLTWTSTNPAMSKLRLGIGHGSGADRQYEFVDGPSPLLLSATGLDITSADEPRLYVWIPNQAPNVYVHTPQSFHVEGTLGFTPKP